MKNFCMYIILASALLTSCSSGLEGEGAATENKEFAIEPFSSIEAHCNCEITLIPSLNQKVVVESHKNLVDNLEIISKGNDLVIQEKSKVSNYDLYNVNIYFTPNLTQIELLQQAKMKISGTLKSTELNLSLKDQTMVHESYVEITDLDISVSDQSQLSLNGTAINLTLDASDESRSELDNLQTVEVDFHTQDNSFLSLNVMKDLNGKATNNSQVIYKGDPNKDTTEKDRALIQQK